MNETSWHKRARMSILGACLLAPLRTTAQPALHEPVQVPRLRCHDGVCRPDGAQPDAMPEAVMSGDGLITSPSGGRTPIGHEQIFASGATTGNLAQSQGPKPGTDPPPVRRSRILPDSATGPETGGERLYHEVFQPAVYPYKRMSVLDAVDDDGAMKLRSTDPRRIDVTKTPVGPGRDPFYGSVVVDFVAGQPVPLPTPAAGFRILSYRSVPARSLQFQVDSAENLYATSPTGGRHRLIYLMDVAPRYFAGPLLSPGSPAPLLADVPDDLLVPLPRRLQREATAVLRHIGVRTSSGSDYQAVLAQLVNYFRGFSVGELPDEGAGDLYLKLAMSRRGACRHRSYAFVITALQAGIPARYVENELHVFVEVWIPDARGRGGYFRRINLGGAPLQQRVVDGENKTPYREKGSDPFPSPPSFTSGVPPEVRGQPPHRESSSGTGPSTSESNGTSSSGNNPAGPPSSGSSGNASGAGSGQSGKSQSDGRAEKGSPSGSTTSKPGRVESGSATDSGTGSGPTSSSREDAELQLEDDPSQPEDHRSELGHSLATTQVSMQAATQAYRGGSLSVRGVVRSTGSSASGLEVQVILALSGGSRVLGRAVSQSDGRFSIDIDLPTDLPLGNYRLIARVRGDETRRGSSSGRYDALVTNH